MAIYPSQYAPIPTSDLNSWNTDRDVEPVVMTRGVMYKTGGAWYFWDGQSKSDDAGLMRVSAIGGSTVSLSADATGNRVSAFSNDAGLMRVSALGVTATTAPLSCDGSSVSAFQDIANRLRVSAFSDDAGLLHVSAIGTQTVSAHEVKQSDAAALRISAYADDAAKFRVSAVNFTLGLSANQQVSARNLEGTAYIGSVSANQAGTWAISALAKEGSAFIGQVSATLKAGTANIGLVSATLKEGTAFVGQVSAILKDNATTATYLGRVSSIQSDAANQQTSCKSNDAGTLRTSAYLPVDTVGQMSVFQTLSISASQNVKGSAGTIYGYYFYNTDTKPNYIKIYNVSAAANIGTDTPIMTICLPASAAANAWFGQGLKGFTNGINVTATSGRPLDNTALPAASSVGGNIFYN